MKIQFSDVYVISEIIERKSTSDFFWPTEVRKFRRQPLIDQNKREAWVCKFMNQGLLLDAKIVISKDDYQHWPQSHLTDNPNITSSHLSFHQNYELEVPTPALHFIHLGSEAEFWRKKIYISKRFGSNAHQIFATQFFQNSADKNLMNFALSFERKIDEVDLQKLQEIKLELKQFDNVKLISDIRF